MEDPERVCFRGGRGLRAWLPPPSPPERGGGREAGRRAPSRRPGRGRLPAARARGGGSAVRGDGTPRGWPAAGVQAGSRPASRALPAVGGALRDGAAPGIRTATPGYRGGRGSLPQAALPGSAPPRGSNPGRSPATGLHHALTFPRKSNPAPSRAPAGPYPPRPALVRHGACPVSLAERLPAGRGGPGARPGPAEAGAGQGRDRRLPRLAAGPASPDGGPASPDGGPGSTGDGRGHLPFPGLPAAGEEGPGFPCRNFRRGWKEGGEPPPGPDACRRGRLRAGPASRTATVPPPESRGPSGERGRLGIRPAARPDQRQGTRPGDRPARMNPARHRLPRAAPAPGAATRHDSPDPGPPGRPSPATGGGNPARSGRRPPRREFRSAAPFRAPPDPPRPAPRPRAGGVRSRDPARSRPS
jgi:hypothetical protein